MKVVGNSLVTMHPNTHSRPQLPITGCFGCTSQYAPRCYCGLKIGKVFRTRLLCPYQGIRSPIFFVQPQLARAVRKSEGFVFPCTDRVTRLVNRLLMASLFFKQYDFLARPTHCVVQGSNVYEPFAWYSNVRK